MRRIIVTVVAALAVLIALGTAAVAGGDGSPVTRARLERSLPVVFSHLYVQQTHLFGRHDVTTSSMHAKAMCDKHGPDVADVGPGGDWVCLVGWDDPQVPMPPEGYGKFELNVHSNGCFTAGGPTKLTGFLTITDSHGKDVPNPVFEFDGCFDPHGDNSPTGVFFPSVLSVTSTTLTPDAHRTVGVQVICGTGSHGCAGTVTATSGSTALGTVPYHLKEEASATIAVPTAVPAGAKDVAFQFHPAAGIAPSSPVTVPVG